MKKYLKKNSFLKFFSSIKPLLNNIYNRNRIKVVLILFFCVFIISIFSGCNESSQNNYNNSKKVDILSYNITTEWSTGCTCDNTYVYNIEPGFYHTIYQRIQASYFIRGEIKNAGGTDINLTNINIDFLARNETVLFDTELLNATCKILNLSKGENRSFLIQVNPEQYDYFKDPKFYNKLREYFQMVDNIEFDISFL